MQMVTITVQLECDDDLTLEAIESEIRSHLDSVPGFHHATVEVTKEN